MAQPSSILSSVFGDSLITPIKRHIAICQETAETLTAFFDTVLDGEVDQSLALRKKIADLENEADEIKREVRKSLHAGLLLSVSRSDLLDLVRSADKIPNICRDLAGLVAGRTIEIPAPLARDFREYVRSSVSSVSALNDVMQNFETLVGTGFMQSRTDNIDDHLNLVDERESQTDEKSRIVQQALFRLEDSLNPVDVMFLYQVIELVGDLADQAEAVGNRVRIILAT
jgi:predicted phosphate transport protein (TIGR00153 family)